MSKLFIESVFVTEHALYDTDTNTVTLGTETYTYEQFDEEFLIMSVLSIDEYNFEADLQDQLYVNHVYNVGVAEYYSPIPECDF